MHKRSAITFFITVFLALIVSSCHQTIQIADISVDDSSTELDLRGSNISDISMLYNLENIMHLDLRDNPIDPEDVAAFMEENPECEVLWSLNVGGISFDSTADILYFEKDYLVEQSEIENAMVYLTELKIVKLYSSNINAKEYKYLVDNYPHIDFEMQVEISGNYYDSDAIEIDLSKSELTDIDDLEKKLEYFNKVEVVKLGESINSDIIDSYSKKYTTIDFVWDAPLNDIRFSSNLPEINISGNIVNDMDEFKKQLSYFTKLDYIDMCDCGLTNLQMEALIAEYPQVKFVWKIRVGSWEMRTDIKAFGTCYSGDFEGGTFVGDVGFFLYPEDAANLKYCKDLVTLDIGHQYYIYDYSFLKELKNLKHLIVALSNFEDLSVIVDLKELEFLEIFNTNVYDLSPLLELPNLKYLNCSQTLIKNVDYLVDMQQLEVLWICNCQNLSRKDSDCLYDILPNCYVNNTAQGSSREGWRSYDNQGYVDMRESLDMPLAFLTDH